MIYHIYLTKVFEFLHLRLGNHTHRNYNIWYTKWDASHRETKEFQAAGMNGYLILKDSNSDSTSL